MPKSLKKEAGVVENPQVRDHAGLLVDRLPEIAGSPFVQSSDKFSSFRSIDLRLSRVDAPRKFHQWYALCP
jgi:hypothetical protein